MVPVLGTACRRLAAGAAAVAAVTEEAAAAEGAVGGRPIRLA